jgi:hypothetical protein
MVPGLTCFQPLKTLISWPCAFSVLTPAGAHPAVPTARAACRRWGRPGCSSRSAFRASR